jgi:hypothetical protein
MYIQEWEDTDIPMYIEMLGVRLIELSINFNFTANIENVFIAADSTLIHRFQINKNPKNICLVQLTSQSYPEFSIT